MDVDVAILGAGFAGLAAADVLTHAGKTVCVLEARDRVGGRVATTHLADGTAIDVGGQWLGPTHDRMYALCRRFGVEVYPMYVGGKNVMLLGGRRSLFTGNLPLRAPVRTLASLAWVFVRLHMLAPRIPLDAPWLAKDAALLDQQTLGDWMRRNVPDRDARALVELGVESVFAADPDEISLLHALFYMHSGNSFDFLTKSDGGAQQDRLSGGVQQVAERLAESLGERGEVVLSSPVTRVEDDGAGVVVTSERAAVRAQRVIVALPPPLLRKIAWSPALSSAKSALLERLPMGAVIKCIAVYEQPFWRRRGLSGQGICDIAPVKAVFDASPKSGVPGVLMAFIEGSHARAWSQRTEGERREVVLEACARFFGAEAKSPRHYLDKAWPNEAFSGGCYSALFGPGVWTRLGAAVRRPEGRLHWAGTETATRWNGYIEGAVLSGERAAREVLSV